MLIFTPMSVWQEKAYTSFRLGNLTLRNRFIKTATHEGMTPGGMPTERLIDFHRLNAIGGVALTTVAYGGVNRDSLTHDDQMVIGEAVLPALKRLADAVHDEGAAVSMQLTHCGYFSKSSRYLHKKPLAPSKTLNKYGLLVGRGFARAMSEHDIERTANDFALAAGMLKETGFDALELHMGHGYLLSQFLTPSVNRRRDEFGGSPGNRLRFPMLVYNSVRKEVGEGFPLLVKMNMSDGFSGGLMTEESLQVAETFEEAGANALILSGGYTSKTPFYLMRGDIPRREMIRAEKIFAQKLAIAIFGRQIIRKYHFEENFFLEQAIAFRRQLKMPLAYIGGVTSASGIAGIMKEGFDLIALGRALIHDPNFITRARKNHQHISACNHCNVCVAEIESKGIHCPIAIL
jgi:2,4-dienoyl-CoA reductase-like NADH-dependent reductase (Old Yellow Enzyme family)